jgi:hypothetical protein
LTFFKHDDQDEVSNEEVTMIVDKTRENFYKMQEVVALMARLAQNDQEGAMTDRSIVDVRDQIEDLMSDLGTYRHMCSSSNRVLS